MDYEKIKKFLKVSGIMDIVISTIYMVIGIVLAICISGVLDALVDDVDSVTEALVGTLVLVLVATLLIIAAIVVFVFGLVGLIAGISTLKASKQDNFDVLVKRRGRMIFGAIVCFFFFIIVLILSIVFFSSLKDGIAVALLSGSILMIAAFTSLASGILKCISVNKINIIKKNPDMLIKPSTELPKEEINEDADPFEKYYKVESEDEE